MKVLFCLVLSALAFGAHTAEVLDCRSAFSSNSATRCAEIDREVAELRMKEYLEASKKRFADDDLILYSIENAQAYWMEYRKNHCDVVFDISNGSIRENMALACEAEITRERTHQLWRSYIATNTTNPSLPEPSMM